MNSKNAAAKAQLIRAKFPGTLVTGQRFRSGEYVVYFPRMSFEGKSEDGKSFRNVYVRPRDMKHFADMAEAREKLMKQYGMTSDEFDAIGRLKTEVRK